MLFTSLEFILFFTCSFILFYTLRSTFQKPTLLLGSCLFIGYFNILFLIIALGISILTFYWGKWISVQQKESRKKRVFTGGIIALIGFLIVFKYLGFIESNLQMLFSFCGIHWNIPRTTLLFPLGISFYTFQALSYLIDVYWEEEEAEKKISDFILYMLFFMKFLSGPIERGYDLLPQLRTPKRFNYDTVVYGIKLICIGLMKKVIIADRLAPYLDGIFNSIQDASGAQLIMAGLLYPIQLYADFSGYTDMAIGGALLFGIRLSPNFNRPFAATTITDFWRRWHMSLSFWVRDYLYQPIAAEKRYWGTAGMIYGLLVTFTILGIWHGAGWNYVLYGLLQGVYITYEMLTASYRNHLKSRLGTKRFNALFLTRTYLLFSFSLLFFRITSLSDIGYYIGHLSFNFQSTYKELKLGMTDQDTIIAGCGILLLFLFEYFMSKRDLLKELEHQKSIVRWTVYYLFISAIFLLGNFGTEDFIYLQF